MILKREATFHPKIESIDSHSDGLRSPSSASFNNDTSSHHEVSVVCLFL